MKTAGHSLSLVVVQNWFEVLTALRERTRLGGNVPREPVKDVIGTAERDIQIMEDDREAHRSVRDIREGKSRPNVAATASIPIAAV